MAKQSKTDANVASFGPILGTRDPQSIQDEIFVRLEQERVERMKASSDALAADRETLEAAVKELSGQVPPERLRRLTGLIGLIGEQQAQAEAALKAVKDAPAIKAGGWLLMGQVRDSDAKPVKGSKIEFK